jgi:nucleotide-binding universal stress UspA family protein
MKLLVGVDLSTSTDTVLARTAQIAKSLAAQVWLLHVAEPEPSFVGYDVGPQPVRDSLSQDFHKELRQVEDLAGRLRLAGLEVTALVVQGATVDTILSEAAKLEADMIVMGSHGHGAVYQLLVGSVCEGVLRKATCPVLVVPIREK